MLKRAFTIIELVFVIVVLSILASVAIPRLNRDYREEVANSIISSLMYTKHMALIDNVTNPLDNRWQRAFWRFGIQSCSDDGIFYYIASDKNYGGNINGNESVIDPSNGKIMMGSNTKPCKNTINNNASKNIFLTKNYGITDEMISFNNCKPIGNSNTQAKHIGFDYFGRLHRGFSRSNSPNFSSRVHSDCQIKISFPNDLDDIIITIQSNTGHISVTY